MSSESFVVRSIFLLFLVIGIISAGPLQYSNQGGNNGSKWECGIIVSDQCFSAFGSDGLPHIVGSCKGGVCGRCPIDPLRCCALAGGTCMSANNIPYGFCAPTCE